MRYQNGWIKFYREIRYKDFYKDLRLRGLVMDLLLVANYEESKIRLGKELRTLKPGQILTKASELSQNNPIPPRTIHRLLARLELDGFISQELTSRGTIVTICNWNKYQANTSDNSSDLATEWRRNGDGVATEWRRSGDGMATEWRRNGDGVAT